jgi:hypothetical protein
VATPAVAQDNAAAPANEVTATPTDANATAPAPSPEANASLPPAATTPNEAGSAPIVTKKGGSFPWGVLGLLGLLGLFGVRKVRG